MADLISRAAAIDAIVSATVFPDAEYIKNLCQNPANSEDWLGGVCDAIDAVEDVNAVDAAPVVHGRWKAYSVPHWTKRYDDNGDPEYKYHNEYVCSICRRRTIVRENYCPNCGAKMDKEGE